MYTHREICREAGEKFITLFMHPNWMYFNVISREMKKQQGTVVLLKGERNVTIWRFLDDFI